MAKSLFEYDVLINDTFYRSHHVLTWIDLHKEMSQLDREAICATIMDALVYKGLINPENEFLNLDNLLITNNPDDYKYDKHPFVCGIPMWMKEMFRTKSLVISGSIPVSIFLAKPAGGIRYCVYDPNTAVSSFFDEFRFIKSEYDSPTRSGVRAEERPFVEVKIDGISYLVDILTKRIFKTEEFTEMYNMVELDSIKKSDFDRKRKQYYAEQTTEKLDMGTYLLLSAQMLDMFNNTPEFAEMSYEIQKSKEYCPDGWKQYEEAREHMALFFGGNKI